MVALLDHYERDARAVTPGVAHPTARLRKNSHTELPRNSSRFSASLQFVPTSEYSVFSDIMIAFSRSTGGGSRTPDSEQP